MKVTAFVGSGRKKFTYNAVKMFLEKLSQMDLIEYEIVMLGNYDLNICRGCKVCIDKGEELCPMKDDRDELINKIKESDGIILASPNYSFNVSGQMKVFLDRFGYLLHRPEFFGKTFTSLTVQGIYGGNRIVKYFNYIGWALGFNVVKGVCINALEPVTEKAAKNIERKMQRHSVKFYRQLKINELANPSLMELMIFRMGRTSKRILLNEEYRDYSYAMEQGWFESDYYYPVKLNPIKRIAGKLFDILMLKIAGRNRQKEV